MTHKTGMLRSKAKLHQHRDEADAKSSTNENHNIPQSQTTWCGVECASAQLIFQMSRPHAAPMLSAWQPFFAPGCIQMSCRLRQT